MVLLKCVQDAMKKGKIQVPFIGMAKCFLRKVDIAHKVVETDVENDNSINIIFCQRIHAFFVFQKSTVVALREIAAGYKDFTEVIEAEISVSVKGPLDGELPLPESGDLG